MQAEAQEIKLMDTEDIISKLPDFVKDNNYISMNNGRYLKQKESTIDTRDKENIDGNEHRVFLAWDTKLEMLVSIKSYTFDPKYSDFAGQESKVLTQEIKNTNDSRSANAQRVFDVFEEEGKKYMVTYAYVSGYVDKQGNLIYKPLDLESLLENGKLDTNKKVLILNKLIDALIKLWRLGKVHWDIKPGNIIIKDEEVFLIDFGLTIGKDDYYDEKEQAPTPYYASPERARLEKIEGDNLLQSEVFSFGLIAFYLLFEEHLYEQISNNFGLLITTIREMDLNNLNLDITKNFERIINNSQFNFEQREKLKDLFRKILAQNPLERPSFIYIAKELNEIFS